MPGFTAGRKSKKQSKNKNFESKDPYGIPIISLEAALDKSVSIGLGPLHTQYDSKPCVVYTFNLRRTR